MSKGPIGAHIGVCKGVCKGAHIRACIYRKGWEGGLSTYS